MCHILGVFEVGLLCAEQGFAFICMLACAVSHNELTTCLPWHG